METMEISQPLLAKGSGKPPVHSPPPPDHQEVAGGGGHPKGSDKNTHLATKNPAPPKKHAGPSQSMAGGGDDPKSGGDDPNIAVLKKGGDDLRYDLKNGGDDPNSGGCNPKSGAYDPKSGDDPNIAVLKKGGDDLRYDLKNGGDDPNSGGCDPKSGACDPKKGGDMINQTVLYGRAKKFAYQWSYHQSLAAPAADLVQALAAADDDPKAKLKKAASALTEAAANDKLPEDAAATAMRLALDVNRLLLAGKEPETAARWCCWWCDEPRLPLHKRDIERQKLLLDKATALYSLSMPCSLALLPYLSTSVPKGQQALIAIIYGAIFSSASVGLVLSLHALDRFDLELARFFSRLSFIALSVLVVVYLSWAMAPGNVFLIVLCLAILTVGHSYPCLKSCYQSRRSLQTTASEALLPEQQEPADDRDRGSFRSQKMKTSLV